MPFPAVLADRDQSAFCQDAHVLGDRRLAHVKVLRYGIQSKGLACQQPDDGPSGGIGNQFLFVDYATLHHKTQFFKRRDVF